MRGQKAITLPDRARTQALASLRRYFDEHMDESIGDLKAALLLDYMLVELGPAIYNQAIADARGYMEERAGDLPDVLGHAEFTYWPKPKGTGR
jgi:uncharacterized protein (DUF2164 family)